MNDARPPDPPGIDWSEKVDQLIPALLEAQNKIGPAKKEAVNTHLGRKYADLAGVQECCTGPLHEVGIVVLNPLAGRILSCLLVHQSGQWVRSWIELPTERPRTRRREEPESADLVPMSTQERGGAITYYRRYLLSALLALATEDDDGAAASGQGRERRGREQDRRPAGAPAERSPQEARQDGRRRVNEEFPTREPRTAQGGSQAAESWSGWILNRVARANQEFAAHQRKHGVQPIDLTSTHRELNHLISYGIEEGYVLDEEVLNRAGTRDNALAHKTATALYRSWEDWVRDVVEVHILSRWVKGCAAQKIPLPPELEARAAQTAELHCPEAPEPAHAGREPGQDG